MRKIDLKNVRDEFSTYIGNIGEIFLDDESIKYGIVNFRASDGMTPGGLLISGGGGGGETAPTADGTFTTLPDFLEFVGGTFLRTGQTSNGVFFDGNAGSNDISYPVRTNFSINGNTKVIVTVDMLVNDECSDFGLCVFEDGVQPEWKWGRNTTRIAAQYNCTDPKIDTFDNSVGSGWSILGPGTYRVRFTYDPSNTPNLTLETLDTSDNVLDTITTNGTLNTSVDYRIGFAADQDDTAIRTYIQNLNIDINGGNTYSDSLQLSGAGGGATGPTGPAASGVFVATNFTATLGQTVFTVDYVVDYIEVYINGAKLIDGVDFTATNGTSFTLAAGANAGDTVEVVAWQIANVTQMTGPAGVTGPTGSIGADGASVSIFVYTSNSFVQMGTFDPLSLGAMTLPTPAPSGGIQWNNSTQINSTSVYISAVNGDGFDIGPLLGTAGIGKSFSIQDKGNSGNFQKWEITGVPTLYDTTWIFPVVLLDSGGDGTTNFLDGTPIALSVVYQGLTGPTGSVGAASTVTGPRGNTGPQGVQGSGGSQGAPGVDGMDGATGPVGATGPAGTNGTNGSNGANGATGYTGPAGVGTTGPAGTNGSNGSTGYTGPAGSGSTGPASIVTGPTGPAGGGGGSTGYTGPQGIQGVTGPAGGGGGGTTGPAGATGPVGSGSTGPTGLRGTTGYTGPAGTNGTNGSNGSTGPAGTNGSNGATGPAGTNGTNGATGPQGVTGPAGGGGGSTGYTGPQGIQGVTGPAGGGGGTTGPAGSTGPQGIQGVTGPAGGGGGGTTGPAGSTGPAGTNGSNGATGYTGPAGGGGGSTGPQGIQGPTGWTGPAGSGSTGPAGTNGTNGATGPAGTNGTNGSTGPVGATGPAGGGGGTTGPAGSTGPQGIQGVTGPAGTGGGGAAGVFTTYYDKVVISYTASAITSCTFTSVSGNVASVTGSGTSLTITMNAGFIPYQWIVYGHTGAAPTDTWKTGIGTQTGGTATMLSNLANPASGGVWTLSQATTTNTYAGSGAGSSEILILSRSTSL